MEKLSNFVTNSISHACYCLMSGMTIVTAKRLGKKFVFEFKEAPEVGESMELKYVNSESRRYDEAMKALKSLLYSDTDGGT